MDWKTTGPRISAAYDLSGNGRTGLKFAAGRYYYMIPASGGILGGFNPNGNYSENYEYFDSARMTRLADTSWQGRAWDGFKVEQQAHITHS